jgi:hypothetical protein
MADLHAGILASSAFDATAESWTVVNNGASVIPDYHATGGNPGGYISDSDAASGPIWYFSAPAIFLGDQSAAYGGLLSFDFRRTTGTVFNAADVVLTGSGATLVIDLATPATTFTHYPVSLVESAGWRVSTLAGAVPTQSQMIAVLSGLTALEIRGEHISGADTGSLDNVILDAGPAPEPFTFALVGLALCGIGCLRRRKPMTTGPR